MCTKSSIELLNLVQIHYPPYMLSCIQALMYENMLLRLIIFKNGTRKFLQIARCLKMNNNTSAKISTAESIIPTKKLTKKLEVVLTAYKQTSYADYTHIFKTVEI